VESSLLYDCQARVWYKKDVRALQSWMDRCYRLVWSGGRGHLLSKMQEQGRNMVDVRGSLEIRSVEAKVEKRVLERIGHVMRMGDERMTKAIVLGWYEGLEGRAKRAGRKWKTVLYWRRVLVEARVEPMEMEKRTRDRTESRKIVKERIEDVDLWVAKKGHKYEWRQGEVRVERSQRQDRGLICEFEGYGKRCKSKGGLTIHQKIMHREGDKVMFGCARCGKELKTEGASHERSCTGREMEGEGGGSRRECGRCGRWVTYSNYARHVSGCGGENGEGEIEEASEEGGAVRRAGGDTKAVCGVWNGGDGAEHGETYGHAAQNLGP